MRKAFINTLIELAEKDESIYLLSGDLGFSVFEEFIEKFPQRFLNCGVAEQNMVGLAAGLALEGKKPYLYSIIPFLTMRCFEQIRNDICYQNLNVKLVGIGSGLTYGHLGATHWAIEDIAILRALPNLTLLCPADPIETRELLLKAYLTPNPTYIRLVKRGEKIIHNQKDQIEIGKPSVLREGKEGAIIAAGIQVEFSLQAIEKLKKLGHNYKLISLHSLKPVDRDLLLKEIKEIKKIFTVEEHNIIGGVGSVVAEILAESDWSGDFKRIAIPDEYSQEIGSTAYLQKKYCLDPERITDYILSQIKK